MRTLRSHFNQFFSEIVIVFALKGQTQMFFVFFKMKMKRMAS